MKLPCSPLFLLITLAVACTPPEVNFDDFRFVCAADADCPSGTRCGVEGDCVPIEAPDPAAEGETEGDDDGAGEGDGADPGDLPDEVVDPDPDDDGPDPDEPDDEEDDEAPDPDPDVEPDPDPDPIDDGPLACEHDGDCAGDEVCGASGFCAPALTHCSEVIDCINACENARGDGQVDGGGPGEERHDEGPDPCMIECFSQAQDDAINPLIRVMACATRCQGGDDDPNDCFESDCESELVDCIADEQMPLTCDEGVACLQYCMIVGDEGGGCYDRCEDEINQEGPDDHNFTEVVSCIEDQCVDYPGPVDRCVKDRCRGQFDMCMGPGGGEHDVCDDVCGFVDDQCRGAVARDECMDLCWSAQAMPDGIACIEDLANRRMCDLKDYDACEPGPLDLRPMMVFETGFHDPADFDDQFEVLAGEWRVEDGELVQNGGCPDCNESMAMARSRQAFDLWSDVYRFGYTITLPRADGGLTAQAFGAVHADCNNMSVQGCNGTDLLRRIFGFRHTFNGTDMFIGGESNSRMHRTPFTPAAEQQVRFEMTCRPSEAEWRIMVRHPHGWDTADAGSAWNHSLCTTPQGAERGRMLLGSERGRTRFDDVFFEMPACWERERDLPFSEGEDSCGVVSYLSFDGWLNNNIYDGPPEWERDHDFVDNRHGEPDRAVRIREGRGLEYHRPRGMDSLKWTMEAWIRPEGPTGDDQYIIDDRYRPQPPGGNAGPDMAPRGRYLKFTRAGEIQCGFHTTWGGEYRIQIPMRHGNQWVYAACSFDGDQLVLVLDDEEGDMDTPIAAAQGVYEPNVEGTLRIGESHEGRSQFNGAIDDVLIHEFAKSRNYMSRRAGM